MPSITGGKAIVESLVAHGVDTIFALPGVQNDHLFNALYDAQDRVQVIHTRHEQATSYMALGYAMSTNKVGVYCVVPGPGVLNTMAALSTAYARNAKVLCLTGQIRSDQIERGFGMLHEIPGQLNIIRTLTKWAERITTPADAPLLVAEAFRQLHSGRPRPVGLEVPPDVLAEKVAINLTPPTLEIRKPAVDPDAIDRAAKLLGEAQTPLIYVGSGAIEAATEVQVLAEALQAPVLCGRSGLGILSHNHYLSQNSLAGHILWANVDVVLAVGTRMQTPQMSWGLDDNLKVVHINLDPADLIRFRKPEVGLIADSKDALTALIPATEKYNKARPSRKEDMLALKAEIAEKLSFLEPQTSYVNAIRDALPDDGIFVDEMTQVGYVSRHVMPVYQPRTHLSPGYQGTLGWGFATALGAKVANPAKAVISVNGDGGFMFNVQELATAVQHNINTVTLVFNDGAYGNVQRMQKNQHGNRVIASSLKNPDFMKLADAFGVYGIRATGPDALRQAIRAGIESNAPTLIEIPVGEMPDPFSVYFLPRVR